MRDKFMQKVPTQKKEVNSSNQTVSLEKNFIKSSPFASFFIMVNETRKKKK